MVNGWFAFCQCHFQGRRCQGCIETAPQAPTQAAARTRIEHNSQVDELVAQTDIGQIRDPELRVLLVVLRQTWGWRMDRTSARKKEADTQANTAKQSARKQAAKHQFTKHQFTKHQPTKRRDWLSHSQLCRRTGRRSDAASAAVASLTASGLIIVEDVVSP